MKRSRSFLFLAAGSLALGLLAPQAANAAPQLSPEATSTSTVTGVFRTVIFDNIDGTSSKVSYIENGTTRTPVPSNAVSQKLRPGATVSLTFSGRTLVAGKTLTPARVSSHPAYASAASAASVIDHRLYIGPVVWPGKTVSVTSAYVSSLISGSPYSVNQQWGVMSEGKISVSSILAPTQTLSTAPPACGSTNVTMTMENMLSDAAMAYASTHGYASTTSIDHLIIVFPSSPCGYAGLGTVGGSDTDGGTIWINGIGTAANDLRVWAHEFGHNLGLDHAGGLHCWADAAHTVPVTISDNCDYRYEYDDTYDVMGFGSKWDLQAYKKYMLGYLPETQKTTVGSSGTYTLTPVEDRSGTGTRLLLVPTPSHLYTMELREPIGIDTTLGGYANPGVVIRQMPNFAPANNGYGEAVSYEMYAKLNASGSQTQGAYKAGDSVTTPDGVTIHVDTFTATNATVTVTIPADTTPPAAFGDFAAEAGDGNYPQNANGWSVYPAATFDNETGLAQYEIWLDGNLITTEMVAPGSPGYGYGQPWNAFYHNPTPLTQGTHLVQEKAYDYAGNVTVTSATILNYPQIAFTTDPTSTVGIGRATSGVLIPVVISWKLNIAPKAQYVDGKAVPVTARSWVVYQTPGKNVNHKIQAISPNPMPSATEYTGITKYSMETKALGTYSGKWSSLKETGSLGGTNMISTKVGSYFSTTRAYMTYAVVARKGPKGGVIVVYRGRTKIATVNLYSAKVTAPMLVAQVSLMNSFNFQTIKIVNASSAKRPTVNVDGLIGY